MTVSQVFEFLNEFAPVSTAEDFDNSGLIIGNANDEVTGIIVSLDCTSDAISKAIENNANLIVTHHPVIFNAIKHIRENDLVYLLLKNGISVISMHTNLDIAEGGVNDELCHVIGLKNVKAALTGVEGKGFPIRIGENPCPCSPTEFALILKEKLGGSVKYVAGNTDIRHVAVCSGAGSEFISDVLRFKADAFVTADIRHHEFIAAGEAGISIYDAGHFNTEDVIIEPLTNMIRNFFGENVTPFHISQIKFV